MVERVTLAEAELEHMPSEGGSMPTPRSKEASNEEELQSALKITQTPRGTSAGAQPLDQIDSSRKTDHLHTQDGAE